MPNTLYLEPSSGLSGDMFLGALCALAGPDAYKRAQSLPQRLHLPDARVEINDKEKTLTMFGDDDFKLGQVRDVLTAKLAKRGVDTPCRKPGDSETIRGNKMKQPVTVREGIEQELAKKIVKLIKDSKMKVQGSIQGDVVRVSGAKKDLLQDAIALIRKSITEFPLQFKNFRD